MPLTRTAPAVTEAISPRVRSALRYAKPWLALLLLNALFVLPRVFMRVPDAPSLLLAPSADLLVIVLMCALTVRLRHGAWVRRAGMLAGFVLWMYSVDSLVGRFIVHQTPLLYDQLFLFKHLGVLVSDLWSWVMFGAISGIVVALTLVLLLAWFLLRYVCKELSNRPLKANVPAATAMAVIMVGASWVGQPNNASNKHKLDLVLWTAPDLGKNLRDSYQMYGAIQKGITDSPYARYEDDFVLTRKPDVQLFLVESYGAVLPEHEQTRQTWQTKVSRMGDSLLDNGWHAVSGYSIAPVSGGRSWLAEASLMTGIRVRYEAVYRHILEDISATPNLVGFLDAQGYETFILAPKDRARKGIELENRYHYDQTIFWKDLHYEGKRVGWGLIPDQYSLGYAHENYFSQSEGPIFTNFHMVSSHAPWKVIPNVVADWEALGKPRSRAKPKASKGKKAKKANHFGALYTRVRRYQRREPKYMYMGEADSLTLRALAQTIYYDLEIIRRHLLSLPSEKDKIVVIMGDHQPPVLSEATTSYDVPVHILARDPVLLTGFKEAGFTDGMVIEPGTTPAVVHEAMFSLFVRNLVMCCSEAAQPPPVQPHGVIVGGE